MGLRAHYTATGYVYDSDTDAFLLIFHKKLGKWLPPGGHLDEGEMPHLGAQRELLEETGLEGQIVDLLNVPDVATPGTAQLFTPFCILSETIPARLTEEEHIHIDFVYAIEVDTTRTPRLEAKEADLIQWISWDQLDHIDSFENVRQVCRAIKHRWSSTPRQTSCSQL